MANAAGLLAYMAACGAPLATDRHADGRSDPESLSASDWQRQIAEERLFFLPQLPDRMRRRLEGEHATMETEIRLGGRVRSLDLVREHTELEEMLVRMLLAREPNRRPRIYLDNHATTPVDPRVADVVCGAMLRDFGNAHSAHHAYGDDADALGEVARGHVAELVGADPSEVHFTSGATESIRVGLVHAIRALWKRLGRSVRVSVLPVEHRAVLNTLDGAAERGRAVVSNIPVDDAGRIEWAELARMLPETDLVVAMGANNEIGNVYPTSLLAKLAQQVGAPIFCDATQAVGKVPVRAADWGLDMVALSAHKIYGPKGCGALVVRGLLAEGFVPPGGTPATPGIVGLGEACRLRQLEMGEDETAIGARRDRMERALLDAGLDVTVNGDRLHRLAGSLHVSVSIPSEVLLAALRDHVALSTGAACASAQGVKSHVLDAMGLPEARKRGAVRIGLGKFTTDQEIDEAVRAIVSTIRTLQR